MSTFKAIVIGVDASVRVVDIDEDIEEENGHSQLHNLVGGWLEFHSLPGLCCNFFINEDGKRLNLQPNARATALCEKYGTGLRRDDFIVGPMVIVGPTDGDSCTDATPEAFKATGAKL